MEENYKRTIKSFVRRNGRVTVAKEKAFIKHSQYVIPTSTKNITSLSQFRNDNPLVVEIGFGSGILTINNAKTHMATNFIGVEVYRFGIGKVLNQIDELYLKNLKIMEGDAEEIIPNCFDAEQVEQFLIFFPDPWHKKRHHKRRLIKASFVIKLIEKLKPNGKIWIATDWQDYKEWIEQVMKEFNSLKKVKQTMVRIDTKFESRGKLLGNKIYDLIYQKQI